MLTLGEIEAVMRCRDDLHDIVAKARAEMAAIHDEPDEPRTLSPLTVTLAACALIGAAIATARPVSRRTFLRPWAWAS